MPSLQTLRALLFLLALLTGPVSAQNAPRPGYLTGQARNAAGAPLADVRLRVFGTTDAGQRSSLNTRSKADGSFALRLPAGNFSLREAIWRVMHEGREYRLPLYLEGEEQDDFDSTEGATARLTLRMAGKIAARKADTDENAWFGGTVELEFINSDGTTATDLPSNAQLTVTLTPRSPRLDGTPAAPLRSTRPLAWTRSSRVILDVPLATYEAQVSLTTGNTTAPLLVSSREGLAGAQRTPLAATAPIRFAPKSGEATLLNTSGVEKCLLQVVVTAPGRAPRPNGAIAAPPAAPATPANNADDTAEANGEWKIGDHLNVLRTPHLKQWHAGTIIAAKAGLYLIKFDAFGAEHNEWVDASRLAPLPDNASADDTGGRWKIGDHLNVLRTPHLKQWHAGTILAIKAGNYLIKFDAFGAEHNEWVDATRLAPL